MSQIKERETYQGKEYVVWDSRRDYQFQYEKEGAGEARKSELAAAKGARYLVDPETGKPAWMVDDAIMGKLKEKDDGSKVNRDFDAPKTQVMGIVINGVLSGELRWDLILMGALIAVMLELCGVSALAFAVGVYVDIRFSTPIFIGGLVRWGVDRYVAGQERANLAAAGDDPEARARAEVEAIRRSETSPGVLLAAGYIAGGSLAGMLLAFTYFSKDLPDQLSRWRYATYEVKEETTFDEVADELARQRIRFFGKPTPEQQEERFAAFREELDEINAAERAFWARVPAGAKVLLKKDETYTAAQDTTLGAIIEEKGLAEGEKARKQALDLLKLNKEHLVPFAPVPRGTRLRLKKYDSFEATEDTTVGAVAKEREGGPDAALALYERNREVLRLPAESPDGIRRLSPAARLPTGTTLKLPQKEWPALVWFGVLVAILAAVGAGKLLKAPPEEPAADASVDGDRRP
jgi:hypothetical protein